MSTAASRRTNDPYLGKTVAGRYRLEARLGEGGMGVVYRARHVLIDRVVALKLIRPDLRGETHLRAWMLREARAANRVDHAHIVQIHDVGETEEGELYLVMEYLVGTALSAECGKGPMPIERAVDIIEQMCAALARAHDLGVVHRDLKSDNIMLTMQGGRRDFVKILDFGLAALDARRAARAQGRGVRHARVHGARASARRRRDRAVRPVRARHPVLRDAHRAAARSARNDRETLLEMQRSAPPPRPRSLRPDIAPQAEAIILRLLEKDPSKRFRDGHHLQEELKALPALAAVDAAREARRATRPRRAAPPPPAPSPGVQEWGTRAANFQRTLARAYPNGKRPPSCRTRARHVWELALARVAARGRAREPLAQARRDRASRPRAARRDRPQGRGARDRRVARAA